VFEGWKPVCSQYLYPLFRHVLVVFDGVRGLEASLFTIYVSPLQARTGSVRWCSRVGSQSVHNICILSSGTYWLCSVVFEGWKPVCSQYLYPLFRHVLVVFGGVRGLEASLFTISVSSLQARTGCVRWCSRAGCQSVHNICILSSGTYWLCSVVFEGWKPVCLQYMYPLFRHVLVVFGVVRGLDANLFTISVSSLQARTGCVRWCSRVGSQSVHNICILSSCTYWLCSVVCEGWKPICSQYLYPLFRHVLVVFGGVRGLEASLEADENLDVDDPSLLFQHYLNACPSQGSRTIRTEVGLDN